MNLQMRIDLVTRLGQYILSDSPEWLETKQRVSLINPWFTSEFIDIAAGNLAKHFLDKKKLESWTSAYKIETVAPKKIGIVMAGNIPLVGFHDFLCVFISGHKAIIKPSSKDEVLIKHLAQKLIDWDKRSKEMIVFQEMLKDCDA
ncbi:MAG TPA: acyl-CoA reductase, partial [Chitinophagaceae bacterium]|nr:acyl-CoA reductase [Chitinophagaceae bacterium]